jgi:hypothetical protein
MQTVFADSFYFFALGNRHDPAHAKASAGRSGMNSVDVRRGVTDALRLVAQKLLAPVC